MVLIYSTVSWNQIRHTAGATDAEITARFRRTAFHDTLVATLVRKQWPNGYILLPAEALATPSHAEIASRWPGIPSEDVAALARDYVSESQQLAALRLEDVVDRVKELANEDIRWG